ncbi:MAG TPA: ABC transporter permease [Euryarchaeota archaeon]|nr:ABC transporter permease [Euryarchaeota archaeon]
MKFRGKWDELKVSMAPRIEEWKFILKRMSESPLAVTGLAIIISFVIIACLAPILAPPQGYDPFVVPQDVELAALTPNPTPPTTRHIFGTTDQQYDIYYACIWGTISAFRIGLTVVIITLVIGLVLGTISAYYGRVIDEILMRFTDIIIAFPGLVLAMALVIAFPTIIPLNITLIAAILLFILLIASVILRSNKLILMFSSLLIICIFINLYYPLILELNLSRLDKVLISLSLVGWPSYARLIRSEVLRVKNEDFVEAAKAAGCSDLRIIVKHIWPNTIYSLLIVSTLDIGSIVLTAAALSFLGIGAEPNFADWGQIISRSRNWISRPELLVRNWHTFVIPGIFITLFVLGWNLLGDALRDVLDPMIRRR